MPGRIYFETHIAPLLRMQGEVSEIALDIRRRDGAGPAGAGERGPARRVARSRPRVTVTYLQRDRATSLRARAPARRGAAEDAARVKSRAARDARATTSARR